MSSAIGYVETVREDLLDAAWRSTMSAPRRAPRRRPSTRWVVAGATALTLIAAGTIGWQILASEGSVMRASAPARGRVQEQLRPSTKAAGLQPGVGYTHAAVPGSAPNPGDTQSQRTAVAGSPAGQATAAGSGAFGALAEDQAATDTVLSRPAVRPPGEFAKIIKTGRMSIVVGHDTFGERFTAVGDIADRLGGFISSSSTSGGRSGFVTMRIPANRFQDALRSLRGLGRVDAETIEGNDVTAEYVDLRARIRIARARRQVLFGLMKDAVSIDQTIRVQNALEDVQLRIEELQGQLNVLNDRVDEATIRVSMREMGVKVEPEPKVENPSIPGAFEHALAGFLSVVAAVIVGLGWVIPTIVVLALLWLIVTRVRRRLA